MKTHSKGVNSAHENHNHMNRTHRTTVFLLLVAISLLAQAHCFAAQSLVIAPPGCCVFFHGSYNNENFFREGFAGESCYGNGQGPTITDAPDAIVANNCPYSQSAWAT